MSKTKKSEKNEMANNVLLDVVEHIKDDNIISSKKGIKYSCCAAVKHTTKENSLNDLNKGLTVYLTKKDTTGKNDVYSSYVQCSKCPTQEGNTMCHIHTKTNPDKLIKMEDLIKNAFKASVEHEYYDNKGIRGAKGNKKNNVRDNKQQYSIKNINYILDSDNDTIIRILEQMAQKIVFKYITNSKVSKSSVNTQSNKELLEFLEKKNGENNSNELVEFNTENDSYDLVESETEPENNLLLSSHQDNIDENNEDDEDTEDNQEEDNKEEEEEEEGVECVEITTINGTTFYLDESSNEVYKIVEDQNILIGKLKEVNEKYFQINHKDKKWSIFSEETKNGKPNLKCYLTNKKFDLNLKPLK
jgi:hypothetical protein